MDDLSYANCNNMTEYLSKYYILKTSFKKQSITIEDAFKIWILNNLGLAFKIYLTVVNDRMRKYKKLEEDKVLFKAIGEKESWILAELKTSVNFVTTNSHYFQPQRSKKGPIE